MPHILCYKKAEIYQMISVKYWRMPWVATGQGIAVGPGKRERLTLQSAWISDI
jgi:hypothetical protein